MASPTPTNSSEEVDELNAGLIWNEDYFVDLVKKGKHFSYAWGFFGLLRNKKTKKDVRELLLSEDETVLAFLEIFASATKALQSSSVPTMNLLALTFLVIKADLEDGAANEAIINKSVYEIALANLNKRLQPTKFQMCAALLDPTSCNVGMIIDDIAERFNEITRIDLLEYYLQKYKMIDLENHVAGTPSDNEEVSQEPSTSAAVASATSYKATMFRRLGVSRVATPTGFLTLREEIIKYFEKTQACAPDANILEWWKGSESVFPRISKLAKFVLGCPATSAASESAFSSADCIATAKRSTISPFKVADILFVKDNYPLLKSYFSPN